MPNLPPWVNDYVGLPFKEKGRDRNGIDCWGLNWLVQREAFHRDVPRFDGRYETVADVKELERLIRNEMPTARPVAPKPGATAFFIVDGHLAHVGVVVTTPYQGAFDPGYFLHAQHGIDSCVDRYIGMRWNRRLSGFYEYEGPDLLAAKNAKGNAKKIMEDAPGALEPPELLARV
jgi:hypothetical protein